MSGILERFGVLAVDPVTQNYRSYWHPYTDDTAIVDVTGAATWFDLERLVPSLQGYNDANGIGFMWRAFRNRRPYNSPRFGCFLHTE